MSRSKYVTNTMETIGGSFTTVSQSDERIRLNDYLDDKIQTTSDFKSLASLIASVEGQRKDLEEQVNLVALMILRVN